MLSKICYQEYVEKPLAGIVQNKRKDIHDFLWNYRKVRVTKNKKKHYTAYRNGMLARINIETQCEAVQCSILAKSIKEKCKKNGLIS